MDSVDIEVLRTAEKWRKDGRKVALGTIVNRWPAVFGGSDMDPQANQKRMEALVKKIEDLAAGFLRNSVAARAGGNSQT